MKLLYKPIGILLGILAGILGKAIFRQVWSLIDKEDPPGPTDREVPLGKVALAAAVQGSIFRVTRAMVDRAGAVSVEHLTGFWPGQRQPDRG